MELNALILLPLDSLQPQVPQLHLLSEDGADNGGADKDITSLSEA